MFEFIRTGFIIIYTFICKYKILQESINHMFCVRKVTKAY